METSGLFVHSVTTIMATGFKLQWLYSKLYCTEDSHNPWTDNLIVGGKAHVRKLVSQFEGNLNTMGWLPEKS